MINPVLFRWGQWTDCNKSCGGGKRRRSRRCIQKKGDKKGCFNGGPRGDVRFREMVEECNVIQCPSECIAWTYSMAAIKIMLSGLLDLEVL